MHIRKSLRIYGYKYILTLNSKFEFSFVLKVNINIVFKFGGYIYDMSF